MARVFPTIAIMALATLAVGELAHAQFGSIFSPPRPPADVPNRAPPPPNFPSSRDQPPNEALPPPTNLPPSQRPGAGGIQSQPLAPPPGSLSAPPASLRGSTHDAAPGQRPQQNPSGATEQRQPRGAQQQPQQQQPQPQQPQQPAAIEPAPNNDEVVVEPPEQKLANPTAVFSGLDKITGRTITFDVAINETVQFGALQVTPRVCYSRPPTETPRTDAFVLVDEVTLQGEVRRIFGGWMFAASPGLHAVEHPIYDVWLTDCKGATPPPEVTAEAPADAKPAAQKPKPTNSPPQRRRSNAQPSFLSPFR